MTISHLGNHFGVATQGQIGSIMKYSYRTVTDHNMDIVIHFISWYHESKHDGTLDDTSRDHYMLPYDT